MKYIIVSNLSLSQQYFGFTQQNSKFHLDTAYFWIDNKSQILSLHIEKGCAIKLYCLFYFYILITNRKAWGIILINLSINQIIWFMPLSDRER